MVLYTFLINAALAALASFLITPFYLAKFSNGEYLGLIAFIAAIVGGFNQIRGALAGGLLIGVLDNLTATYVTAEYRAALPLVLLIAIILCAPRACSARPKGGTSDAPAPRRVCGSRSASRALVAAPLGQGNYIICCSAPGSSITIAAMGLNLTLGYAGQISLAQGSFMASAPTRPRSSPSPASPGCRDAGGGRALLRRRPPARLPGAAGEGPFPRLRDARLQHPRRPRPAQRGLADRRRLRPLQHARARLVVRHASTSAGAELNQKMYCSASSSSWSSPR